MDDQHTMPSPWTAWLEQHATDVPAPDDTLPRPIKVMHKTYGSGPKTETCRACLHLTFHEGHTHRFYKCSKAKISHGPATDWRVAWPACGKFQKKGA